jgi:predicted phosphodiesterase
VSTLADQYVARWPDMPSRTLARKMRDEHPLDFTTYQSAYSAVRYRRGIMGRKNRTDAKIEIADVPTAVNPNPLALPKSFETEFEPYAVQVDCDSRALILSDVHLPYHNIAAVTAAIETGRREEINLILLNGDTLDCYAISRFDKNPSKPSLKAEVDAGRQFLERLRDLFPKARILWKDGNHDERLEMRLMGVPELFEVTREVVNWPSLLNFAGNRVEYVTDQRPIKLGRLTAVHGHEFPKGMTDPVNPARGLYLRAKESAICGHWHRTSEHSERSINGTVIKCWSTGSLCELYPRYARINKWNHGFATVELAPGGAFRVHNRTVMDGVVYG